MNMFFNRVVSLHIDYTFLYLHSGIVLLVLFSLSRLWYKMVHLRNIFQVLKLSFIFILVVLLLITLNFANEHQQSVKVSYLSNK